MPRFLGVGLTMYFGLAIVFWIRLQDGYEKAGAHKKEAFWERFGMRTTLPRELYPVALSIMLFVAALGWPYFVPLMLGRRVRARYRWLRLVVRGRFRA